MRVHCATDVCYTAMVNCYIGNEYTYICQLNKIFLKNFKHMLEVEPSKYILCSILLSCGSPSFFQCAYLLATEAETWNNLSVPTGWQTSI